MTATTSAAHRVDVHGSSAHPVAGWRARIGLAVAIAGVVAALAVPAPDRPSASGVANSGPPTLASTWPSSRPFAIPAVLPHGLSYSPTIILDRATSAGIAVSGDQVHMSVALVPASGAPRILQTDGSGTGSFDGITAFGSQLFWTHSINDAAGKQRADLWRVDRTSGEPQRIGANIGAPEFTGSGYDMQVRAGRLYWAEEGTGTTKVRSIALTGGAIATRAVPGTWQFSAWPWLVSPPSPGQPHELFNLDTGQKLTSRAPTDKIVVCGPVWCRVSAGNASEAQDTSLMRVDGSQARRIATGGASAVADEVALLGRFEPFVGALTSNAATTATPLTLYDVKTGRKVLIEPAATNARASGHYLWWSTGDNETVAWHGLDLTGLR